MPNALEQSLKSEQRPRRRPRFLTLLLVGVVAAGVALANLSSEAVTADHFKNVDTTTPVGGGPERAYGWPFDWYWRSATLIPGTVDIGYWAPSFFQWPVSRYRVVALSADLVVWLALLAGTSVGCELLLRRQAPRLDWRPRVTTFVVVMCLLTPMVLANTSYDASHEAGHGLRACFGWPLTWYWHRVLSPPGVLGIHGWDYSATRLAINLACWAGMLGAAVFAWEWRRRRHPLPLRWSLRTMLVAVALIAILCAGWSVASRRAGKQEPVIEWAAAKGWTVFVERWGPKWLDLFGADPYRRRVVGAQLKFPDGDDEQNEELFKRLRQLPDLRYLRVYVPVLTSEMSAALGDMRQVRVLGIQRDESAGRETQDFLAALGRLTQLERLTLDGWGSVGSGDPAHLAGLTNLKSLSLRLRSDAEESLVEEQAREWVAAIAKLTGLERLSLSWSWHSRIPDIESLRSLANLKSLTLEISGLVDERGEHEYLTGVGKLKQLERLHLSMVQILHGNDLQNLRGLTNLRVLTIWGGPPGTLALLPPLPRLEAFYVPVDDDLRGLASFPGVKWLNLPEGVSEEGLAKLATLNSLAEVTISRDMVTGSGLETLIGLKNLRAVHLSPHLDHQHDVTLTLDNGQQIKVPSSELDEFQRGLQALRRGRPEIIIDADAAQVHRTKCGEPDDLEPPGGSDGEQAVNRGSRYDVLRRLIEKP